MTRRRNADCFLTMCDGSGWIDITEDPDTEQERCPCGRDDRDAEAKREAQRLIHQSYNPPVLRVAWPTTREDQK